MRVLKFFLPGLAAVLLAGCASYHLGSVNGDVAGEKTVEVLPFNNQTLQPRLGDAVTQALRERLQVDSTYRLTTSEPGDLEISGVIRSYDREGLGYLNRDSSTMQNYRVTVIAHVVIRDRTSGKLRLDRDVKGHTLVNVGPDFASSERQAAPMLAADLAQNITELLTEGAGNFFETFRLARQSGLLDSKTNNQKMKKNIALYAIVAAALIAAPAIIRAQDAAATNSPAATAPAKEKGGQSANGKVTAVDTTAMTITVKNQTFNITSTTKITKDGQPATLSDIKVDDTARISFKKDSSGKLNATAVRDGEKKKAE